MGVNNQELLLQLAQARQDLQSAQARVAELEASLSVETTPIASPPPPITNLSLAAALAEQEAQRQQSEVTLQQYAQRMEILHNIDIGIINAKSIQAIVEVALKHIRQLIPCRRAAVILFDWTTEEWLIFADDVDAPSSLHRAVRRPIPPGWNEGFGTAQTRVLADLRLAQPVMPIYKQLIAEGLVSGLQALLLIQGQQLGLLALNADTPGFFTAEHQEIATEVANQLAIAIQQKNLSAEIARHVAELEQQMIEIQHTDAALRRSESLFRATFEQAAVGIAHVALDGRWLQVNQRLGDILGYTIEEMMGKTFHNLTHPADLADDLAASRQLLQGEIQFYAIQKRYWHQRGHLVWGNLTVSLVRDAQGAPDYFVAVVEDITHLKKIEHALLQSEERYRQMIEDQIDLIGRFQPDFKLTFVNRAYGEAFGKLPGEMIGQSVLDLIPSAYHAQVIANIASMNVAKPVIETENPVLMADGTLGWFQWTNRLITDADGNTLEYQAVGRDITDQKHLQAEQQRHTQMLEEMRQFLESTLDAFASSTAVLASDGTILKVNAAWQNFGAANGALSAAGYLDENYLTVCDNAVGLNSDEARLTAAGIRAVIAGEQNDFYLEYPCHSSSEKRWFGLRVTPFVESAPRRVVVKHTDITERMQAEAAEREQRRFAEALRDSVVALTASLDVKIVMKQILDYALKVVPCEAGSIILFEGDQGRLAYLQGYTPEAIATLIDYQFPIASLFFGNMLVNQAPYFVPDTQAAPEWVAVPYTGWIRSSIGIPIELHGQIIGVLIVDSATPHHFKPIDIEKLQVFAHYASLALENAYHVTELEARVLARTIELQAAKERVEGILNNSLDGILLVDQELRIQQTNRAFNTLIACSPEDGFAGSLRDLMHTDDMARVNEVVQAVIGSQGGQLVEMRCYRKNGTLFDAELSIGDIKGDGLVLTLRDISERRRVQNELAEERNLLRTLIDTLPDYIYVKDVNHRTVLCNVAGAHAVGVTPEEIIGTDDFAFFPLEMAIQFQADNEQVFQHGLPILDKEERALGPGGHLIWVSTTKVPLYNLNGELIGLVGTTRDISDYKTREQLLLFHASLQETVTDAVIATDLDFRIQSWNRAAETIYGWRAEEVLGRSVTEVLQTELPSEVSIEQIRREFIEKNFWTGEAIQHHKAGHAIHILGSTVLFKDAQGIPFGVVSVNHDITERKKAEQAMQAKLEEERSFQNCLKELHAITIELTQIDQLDEFYRQTIMLGHNRLGFDRMGLFLYDAEQDAALGTFGIDLEGQLSDERWLRFTPAPQGIFRRAFQAAERFCLDEPAPLYHNMEPVAVGWHAAAALWSGTQTIGWLITDNLIDQQPATKPQMELLALYALTIGTLLGRKQIQAALRESEARYRLLADNITDMVICYNAAGEFSYVSPSSRALLGYEPEALLGQSGFTLIHPDDLVALQQLYTDVLTQPVPAAFVTCRFRHQEGHYLWLEFAAHIIRSEATKEVLEIVVSARNITSRKQAEDALRESEQRFRRLVEVAPVAILISDQAGQITLINNQASLLFGYTEAELVGQPVEVLVPEAARHSHIGNRAAYMAAPRVRRMGIGLELFARRQNGSEFPVEIELSYIETQAGLLVMSFVVDITERKQSAAALEEQRTFLRQVIDVSPSLIFVKDYDGRFVLANPSVAQMYNTTVEALVGKSDADFNPDLQEVADFLAADRQVITSGEPIFIEEPVTSSTGESHWLQTTKVPIFSADGKSKYVLGVATDITARRNAEEALRHNEALLRTVLDNLPIGVWIADATGTITQGNPAGQQIWMGAKYIGLEALDEYKGWWADTGKRIAAEEWAAARAINKGETSLNEEIEIEAFDGVHKYILNSAIPIRDVQQTIQGAIMVNQDITERKHNEKRIRQALEKEKELGELKSRFVSMASHEFRTPLASTSR